MHRDQSIYGRKSRNIADAVANEWYAGVILGVALQIVKHDRPSWCRSRSAFRHSALRSISASSPDAE